MSPVFTPSSRYAGYPLDLPGATAATRYVGATASGAPASGTFAVGDFVIDQTGAVYVCTVAGSPGTWTAVSSGATWAAWAPTYTGFSADPSGVTEYVVVGRACFVNVVLSTPGTSNATGFTMTLPVTPANDSSGYARLLCRVYNSGNYTLDAGLVQITANTAAATLYTSLQAQAWAATLGKAAEFQGFYGV